MKPVELSRRDARRLAVMGQMLSAPRPRTIDEVVRGLGRVQMDPVAPVARTEHLVLWSRLGRRFRVSDLERMLWEHRTLFEYWAFIVPTEDYGVHREVMRRRRSGSPASPSRGQHWLAENPHFRRYILERLRREGPLRSRDFEDRSITPWRSGGWNDEQKRTGLMLDILWFRGEIMIVGRDGQQRIWDRAERSLPVHEPRLSQREVARRILDWQLRAQGVARLSEFGFAFDGRPPGWERALAELTREGVVVPAHVRGLEDEWFVHADHLERSLRPRTALLSPFDRMIHDRDRAEELFGFRYRLEMYVPPAKREFGYYVLPVLHGDRLIGRVDPRFDRTTEVLHVNGVWAEEGAPASAGSAVARSIRGLAGWLGASEIAYSRRLPSMWRRTLRG